MDGADIKKGISDGNMRRVAVIGANGQLGTDFGKVLENNKTVYNLVRITHQEMDITNGEEMVKYLDQINPHIIINTAAFHKVDLVETNPDKGFLVNAIAVKQLAEYCRKKQKILMWFSTDYLFGIDELRQTPYKETDPTGPVNAYGISKLAGENFIKYILPNYYIVRTGELFGVAGSAGKGGNFVETMLKLYSEKKEIKVVNDQEVSPTYTFNLAQQAVELLSTNKYGLYHATSEGHCSWYDFAKEIFRQMNYKTRVKPISSDEFPTPVKRPKYSVLENSNLKKIGINMMLNWKEGLAAYLKERSTVR